MSKTLDNILTELAAQMREQFGEGYFSRPVKGFVVAVAIDPLPEDVERIQREKGHGLNLNGGTMVAGGIIGAGAPALAIMLQGHSDPMLFMAEVFMGLEHLQQVRDQGKKGIVHMSKKDLSEL